MGVRVSTMKQKEPETIEEKINKQMKSLENYNKILNDNTNIRTEFIVKGYLNQYTKYNIPTNIFYIICQYFDENNLDSLIKYKILHNYSFQLHNHYLWYMFILINT